MLAITVDDRAFRGYLNRLSGRMGDLTVPMEEIGRALEDRVRRRFETKTDPTGKAWAPWAQSTKDSYPYAGTPAAAKDGVGRGMLLQRYGEMLKDISYSANRSSVRVGFAQDYATFHEFGTQTMERRGMLYASPDTGTLADDDNAAVIDVLEHWLNVEAE